MIMTYIKDFLWRQRKKPDIDARIDMKDFDVRERDIWYATVWINVGTEIDGKQAYMRPVLVLKKVGSLYRIVPLTTKGKDGSRFYYKIASYDFWYDSFVVLSQTKSVDKKRFHHKVARVSHAEIIAIKKLLYNG